MSRKRITKYLLLIATLLIVGFPLCLNREQGFILLVAGISTLFFAWINHLVPEKEIDEDSCICSRCGKACGIKWEWIGNPCNHEIWCLDCIEKHRQDINKKEN